MLLCTICSAGGFLKLLGQLGSYAEKVNIKGLIMSVVMRIIWGFQLVSMMKVLLMRIMLKRKIVINRVTKYRYCQ